MAKNDISFQNKLHWDEYINISPDIALGKIYEQIKSTSLSICTWYWQSIQTKRRTSLTIRFLTFILLLLGTVLPVISALHETATQKLNYTQFAVVFLATAGLLQVADKVFGWSSGWMRYITTVTTMENLTRVFHMEWASYLVSKNGIALNYSDTKILFDLARKLEQELLNLQADETTKWVTDFNSGISLLDAMIKSQRDETDKKIEAIQAIPADTKNTSGALQIEINHKNGIQEILITLGDQAPVKFYGLSWAKGCLYAGDYLLSIQTTASPPVMINQMVKIESGKIATLQINI